LFLDADVRLISADFILNYLHYYSQRENVVFGGCDYHKDSYSTATSLRYHYGKKREAVKSSERNQNPFKHILSANFLISKKSFFRCRCETYFSGLYTKLFTLLQPTRKCRFWWM